MTTHASITPLIPIYVESCRQYLARCHEQLRDARTAQERRNAELWIINAERQLARWQAAAERQGVQL